VSCGASCTRTASVSAFTFELMKVDADFDPVAQALGLPR